MTPNQKTKKLNSLIDEIGFIEMSAFSCGEWFDDITERNRSNKSLAKHKTKAFLIIEKLREGEKEKINLNKWAKVSAKMNHEIEYPPSKDKSGNDFTKFLESEGYEVVTVKDVEEDIKRVHKNNNLTLKK